MKKIIVTLIMILAVVAIKAQFPAPSPHTLSFSQALLLTNGNSYTVPSTTNGAAYNCVWKVVEHLYGNSGGGSLFNCNGNGTVCNYPTVQITPPGGSPTTVYYMGYTVQTSGNEWAYTATGGSDFNLWLPAGTVITPNNATSMLSVIEFIVN